MHRAHRAGIRGYDSRVVDTHITKLRRALKDEAQRILTIHRIGYRLVRE